MKKLVAAAILCALLPYQAIAQSVLNKLETDLNAVPAGYKAATKRYELISKAINSFNPLTKACGEEKQYKGLFELAPAISGAATRQHIGEVNALALIKCPHIYLSVLLQTNEKEVSASVGVMGITIPPWETAEAVYPYLEMPRFKVIMDKYFKAWVVSCTNKEGKAKIGCNFSNN
jgi:hypothetical protein